MEHLRTTISNARMATLDASIDILTIHLWVFLWQLYIFCFDIISKLWWLTRTCGPSLVVILLITIIVDLVFFAIRTNLCGVPMMEWFPLFNQMECPPTNIILLGVFVCPFTSTDLTWCQNKQQALYDNPVFHPAATIITPSHSPDSFNFTPIGQSFVESNEKLVFLRHQAHWLAPMTSDMVQWDFALLDLDMYVQGSPIHAEVRRSIREGIAELRHLAQQLSPQLQKFSASVQSFVDLQIQKTRSTTAALQSLDQPSWFSLVPLPSLERTESLISRLGPWLPLTPTSLQTLHNVGARLSSSHPYSSLFLSIFSAQPPDYSAIPFIIDSHVNLLNPRLFAIGLVASDITDNLARQLQVFENILSHAANDRGIAHASLTAIRERKQAWISQLLIALSWQVNDEERTEWQISALDHFQMSSNEARREVGYMARNITGMKESNERLREYAGAMVGIAKEIERDVIDEERRELETIDGQGVGEAAQTETGVKRRERKTLSLQQSIRRGDLLTIIQQMSVSTDVLAEQQRVLKAMERVEVVRQRESLSTLM